MRLISQRCSAARGRVCAQLPRLQSSRRAVLAQAKGPAVTERVSDESVAAAASSDVDTEGVPGWQQLVALNALVAVICSVDRAAISVTILPMSAEFLWDDSTKGLISSAFFIGCASAF